MISYDIPIHYPELLFEISCQMLVDSACRIRIVKNKPLPRSISLKPAEGPRVWFSMIFFSCLCYLMIIYIHIQSLVLCYADYLNTSWLSIHLSIYLYIYI